MASASDVGDPSPVKPADLSGALPQLPIPKRPFGAGLEGLSAAYKRAGLGFWAQEPASAEVGDNTSLLQGPLCTFNGKIHRKYEDPLCSAAWQQRSRWRSLPYKVINAEDRETLTSQ